jgi:hypothetical protein
MNVMIATFQKTDIVWSLDTVEEAADSFELTTSIEG